MLGLEPVGKVFLSLGIALVIVYLMARLIGEERKALWFRKRTKYSFFMRRGPLGEYFHFGYPCTKQGVIVTAVMCTLIGISSYCIVEFL